MIPYVRIVYKSVAETPWWPWKEGVRAGRQKEPCPFSTTHMCSDVRLHHSYVVVAPGQLPLLPHVVDADQQRARLPASLLDHENKKQTKQTNNNNNDANSTSSKTSAQTEPATASGNNNRPSVAEASVTEAPPTEASTPTEVTAAATLQALPTELSAQAAAKKYHQQHKHQQ